MTEDQQGRYERALFTLGRLSGAFSDPDVQAALADSIRENRFDGAWVVHARKMLDAILREAGYEESDG